MILLALALAELTAAQAGTTPFYRSSEQITRDTAASCSPPSADCRNQLLAEMSKLETAWQSPATTETDRALMRSVIAENTRDDAINWFYARSAYFDRRAALMRIDGRPTLRDRSAAPGPRPSPPSTVTTDCTTYLSNKGRYARSRCTTRSR